MVLVDAAGLHKSHTTAQEGRVYAFAAHSQRKRQTDRQMTGRNRLIEKKTKATGRQTSGSRRISKYGGKIKILKHPVPKGIGCQDHFSCWISVAMINTVNQSNWGGKALFGLHTPTTGCHRGNWGQELKQEQMQEPWITGLPSVAYSVCVPVQPRTTSYG